MSEYKKPVLIAAGIVGIGNLILST
jgi:hypothetical protein